MSNVSQSLLHPDQYRFGIKSPVLLYSLSLNHTSSLNLYDYTHKTITLQFYNWKLHFVNRYYFCNTELRTAIITEIKGLSIQTQQNTFVLFTLFKLTLDERKTLTKILMRKPLTTIPQNKHTLRTRRNRKTSKQPKAERKGEKAVCREMFSELPNHSRMPRYELCMTLYSVQKWSGVNGSIFHDWRTITGGMNCVLHEPITGSVDFDVFI